MIKTEISKEILKYINSNPELKHDYDFVMNHKLEGYNRTWLNKYNNIQEIIRGRNSKWEFFNQYILKDADADSITMADIKPMAEAIITWFLGFIMLDSIVEIVHNTCTAIGINRIHFDLLTSNTCQSGNGIYMTFSPRGETRIHHIEIDIMLHKVDWREAQEYKISKAKQLPVEVLVHTFLKNSVSKKRDDQYEHVVSDITKLYIGTLLLDAYTKYHQ